MSLWRPSPRGGLRDVAWGRWHVIHIKIKECEGCNSTLSHSSKHSAMSPCRSANGYFKLPWMVVECDGFRQVGWEVEGWLACRGDPGSVLFGSPWPHPGKPPLLGCSPRSADWLAPRQWPNAAACSLWVRTQTGHDAVAPLTDFVYDPNDWDHLKQLRAVSCRGRHFKGTARKSCEFCRLQFVAVSLRNDKACYVTDLANINCS